MVLPERYCLPSWNKYIILEKILYPLKHDQNASESTRNYRILLTICDQCVITCDNHVYQQPQQQTRRSKGGLGVNFFFGGKWCAHVVGYTWAGGVVVMEHICMHVYYRINIITCSFTVTRTYKNIYVYIDVPKHQAQESIEHWSVTSDTCDPWAWALRVPPSWSAAACPFCRHPGRFHAAQWMCYLGVSWVIGVPLVIIHWNGIVH